MNNIFLVSQVSYTVTTIVRFYSTHLGCKQLTAKNKIINTENNVFSDSQDTYTVNTRYRLHSTHLICKKIYNSKIKNNVKYTLRM